MLAELKDGAKRNPIWFGAIAAISGVQGFFAWEFWGAASLDPAHQAALRVLGLGFVAGEVVALDMASRADLNCEKKRAGVLRALWATLALTTFSADINALSRVLGEADRPRIEAAAAFDSNQAQIAALRHTIETADAPYGHPLQSVAAYDAAIAGKQRERETARAAHARTWRMLQLESQLTALSAERAAAVEVAAQRAHLAALEAMPSTHRARPDSDAVEFEPIANLLTAAAQDTQRALGRRPDAQVRGADVRAGMVWTATIAMKLMLTFGIWVGLQRGRGSAPLAAPLRRVPAPALPASQPAARRTTGIVFNKRGQRFGR